MLPDRRDTDTSTAEWVRCTLFGEQAGDLVERLRKGVDVYCEGRLIVGRWEGADGQPKAGLNLTAWRVDPLGEIGRRHPAAQREARAAVAARALDDEPPE